MSLVKQREAFIRDIQNGMPVQASFRKNFPGGLSREKILKEKASEEQKAGLMQVLGTVVGGTGTAYAVGQVAPWLKETLGIGQTVGSTAGSTVSGGGSTLVTRPIPEISQNLPAIMPSGGTVAPPVPSGFESSTGVISGGGGGGGGGAGLGTGETNTTTGWMANNPGLAKAMGGLGAAAGAYGMYDVLKNYEGRSRAHNAAIGAASGYGLAAGTAALLGATLGPVGLALALLGGGAMGGFAKKIMGDKDRWKTEQDKVKKLREQGYNIPVHDADSLRAGRSKQQLEEIEQGKIASNDWGNPIFAQSRNVADLSPIDVQGSASMYERAGKGQENNARLRYELAKAALESQAVREGYGSQTIDWSKVGNVDQIMKQYGNLGDKGQMSTDEWNRRNYEWLAQNNPNLAGLYDTIKGGAFKTSPRRDDKKKK